MVPRLPPSSGSKAGALRFAVTGVGDILDDTRSSYFGNGNDGGGSASGTGRGDTSVHIIRAYDGQEHAVEPAVAADLTRDHCSLEHVLAVGDMGRIWCLSLSLML